MFNIYTQQEGSVDLPNDDICYIITKNGPMMKKKVGIMESLVPIDKISILGDLTPYAKMDVPKIKEKEASQIINFFKDVYEKYKAECNVIVHYNPSTKRYKFQIPLQLVSNGSVEYINKVQYEGFNHVGTIHSHSSMGAFHSHTDDTDEKGWDGFHFTVGNLDKKNVSISCSIVVNGNRFKVDPTDYFEGLELEEDSEQMGYAGEFLKLINREKRYKIKNSESYHYPKSWMDFIDVKTFKEFSEMRQPVSHNKLLNEIKFEDQDYNPCYKCPFKEYKIELQDLEEEEINNIGG